jgi:hypothetical protein
MFHLFIQIYVYKLHEQSDRRSINFEFNFKKTTFRWLIINDINGNISSSI